MLVFGDVACKFNSLVSFITFGDAFIRYHIYSRMLTSEKKTQGHKEVKSIKTTIGNWQSILNFHKRSGLKSKTPFLGEGTPDFLRGSTR